VPHHHGERGSARDQNPTSSPISVRSPVAGIVTVAHSLRIAQRDSARRSQQELAQTITGARLRLQLHAASHVQPAASSDRGPSLPETIAAPDLQ
jgi:hypothetical protein